MSKDEKKDFDYDHSYTAFYFLLLMITMAILCSIFFIAICCARDSLKKAIDVIDASADFIAHNKCVISIPNVHYLFTIIFTVIWLGAIICVFSLN